MTTKSRRRDPEPRAADRPDPRAAASDAHSQRERRSSIVSLRDVIESVPWAQIERRLRKEASTSMLAAGEWLTAVGGALAGREAPVAQAAQTRKRAGATASDTAAPAPAPAKRQATSTTPEVPPSKPSSGKAKPGASKASTRAKSTAKAATRTKTPSIAKSARVETPVEAEVPQAQGLRFPDHPEA